MHARVQPEIGHEPIRAGEPRHRSDRGDQPDRDHHVDARDRHQSRDVRVGASLAGEFTLDDFQILAQPVMLAQVPSNSVGLVGREWLSQ